MSRYVLLALFMGIHASVAYPFSRADQDPPLRVHVYDYVGLPSSVLDFAEAETSRLLRPAIPVQWMTCHVVSSKPCGQEFLAGDIVVRVVPHASAPVGVNAVGAATIAHPGVY